MVLIKRTTEDKPTFAALKYIRTILTFLCLNLRP